jgi:hypothetical protein
MLLLLITQCDVKVAEWCICESLRVCNRMADVFFATVDGTALQPNVWPLQRIYLHVAYLAFQLNNREIHSKTAWMHENIGTRMNVAKRPAASKRRRMAHIMTTSDPDPTYRALFVSKWNSNCMSSPYWAMLPAY